MIRRNAWRLVGPAALLLFAGVSLAGIQRSAKEVQWLGSGRWLLREDDGDVSLAEYRWDRDNGFPKGARTRWHVSAPRISTETGLFLAYERQGKAPSVFLTKDKGDNGLWAFEVVENLRPKKEGVGSSLKEGPKGFTFRVMAAQRDFRGWYLAAEEPTKGQKQKQPGKKRLTLVRDEKKATVFDYVEDHYWIDHP